MNAREWITQLDLAPHPEGGFYRETYHANHWLHDELTLQTYDGKRRTATSIYFLLEGHDVSRFHRLKSDELWYFHTGSALTVHVIDPKGTYQTHALGLSPAGKQAPQLCIPREHIFGATVDDPDGFALVSCMVSPGFDFADFELFDRAVLLKMHPQHEQIINRLTKE
ncbi:cupin domain-containing protein [Alicyclobacillus fodiniaquatilis]|uniref:Cupin domain-containing protein n=1 Tax=Alicyclobacillus fodiniaquatilis TaxID=1661150 RepID=A0ABW4JC22_9BACL